MKIVFLHEKNNITTNFSMLPIYLWAEENKHLEINFYSEIQNNYNFFGDLLFIIRRYEFDNLDLNRVEREIDFFYKHFKKIIYFDDSAALSKINWFISNRVDVYCKRGLLRNKELYKREFYGGRIYSDFYHRNYNVFDEIENNSSLDPSSKYDWSKVEIAWNVGIGIYFFNQNFFKNKFNEFLKKGSKFYCEILNSKLNKFISKKVTNEMIHKLSEEIVDTNNKRIMARITSGGYSNSVGFQRNLIKLELDKMNLDTDKVSFNKYLTEIKNSSTFISPFGWGEICFRDFEALLFGKVLIKPKCDHIETWPNIYKHDMYIPLEWDLSNFKKAIEKSYEPESIQSVKIARKYYRSSLNEITTRVDKIIKKPFY